MILLNEARIDAMGKARQPGGTRCPCCDKHMQVYRRRFLRSMSVELIVAMPWFEAHPGQSIEMNRYLVDRRIFHGTYSKLCFWGLLEQDVEEEAGKKHSGRYTLTEYGHEFVYNGLEIPQYVVEYNKKVIDFEGDMITISDTFESAFDYDELMRGYDLGLCHGEA